LIKQLGSYWFYRNYGKRLQQYHQIDFPKADAVCSATVPLQ